MHDNPTADFAVREEIIFQLFEMRKVLTVEMRMNIFNTRSITCNKTASHLFAIKERWHKCPDARSRFQRDKIKI